MNNLHCAHPSSRQMDSKNGFRARNQQLQCTDDSQIWLCCTKVQWISWGPLRKRSSFVDLVQYLVLHLGDGVNVQNLNRTGLDFYSTLNQHCQRLRKRHKDMQIGSTGRSKFPMGLNLSVNCCLSLCVSPATDCQPNQSVKSAGIGSRSPSPRLISSIDQMDLNCTHLNHWFST